MCLAVREAMCLVELLERMPANKNVLDMGRKLMTEIRRYQNPPPAMHRIMQSALLLLGEDEDTTDVRTTNNYAHKLYRPIRLYIICLKERYQGWKMGPKKPRFLGYSQKT